ncbi:MULTISPECIES: flavin reductase family protein [Microbacterium]|uniref:flavin reductase family protein n=1 Tax=Microbacterium TaxID=33882 RepID=UPI0022F09255|nr:flavin reductase family protein [Streptomyces sp. MS2A]
MSAVDPSLYDSFARYGSGITLVATRGDDHDLFFIAASVLTASVNPFTLAVSVGQDRDALPAITAGAPWAVSVLAAHHLPLVRRLTSPGTRAERLDALGEAGAVASAEGPLFLPDALVTLWCTTHSTTPVNDQMLLVGEVTRGSAPEEGVPLLRWNRAFHTTTRLAVPSAA